MKRVLYIASVLPVRSETFVYREIFALRRLGFKIETASVHTPHLDLGDADLDRLARSTRSVYSVGAIHVGLDVLKETLLHPVQCFGTLARVVGDAFSSKDLTPLRRLKVLWQGVAGISLARRIRPDDIGHIHAHFAHVPATIAMYSARHLDIGFSFTGHAVDLFPERSLLEEKIQRARFVSCISEWHREFYRSIHHRSDEDLVIVRCGVDTSSFPMTGDPKGEVFEILAVGRLVEKKGFAFLLAALASLGTKEGPSIHLTLAGDGPMRAELEERSTSLPSCVRVDFLGETANERVMELMACADLFVLPCAVTQSGDRDGIPVVLMEAMACGRCVVSGDLETIRELVEHEISGIMVPPGDAVALEKALGELAVDPARREALGRRARQRVEEEFDLTLNAKRLGDRLRREIDD
ncbi:MAG: glycosyltransferase family 4 protein [Myxococcota bacterium]|nr:glycosyltransferase family 4 protein [Myxococcota bacterium]